MFLNYKKAENTEKVRFKKFKYPLFRLGISLASNHTLNRKFNFQHEERAIISSLSHNPYLSKFLSVARQGRASL